MKKPLIKALGVILSAAMICGSVPAGVSPALAAEVTEGAGHGGICRSSCDQRGISDRYRE